MNVPSASNTAGTAAGIVALLTSSAAASGLASTGFIVGLSASLGFPPLVVAGVALGVVSMGANYAVTHWAEAKNLNALVAAWWPQIQYSYPAGKNGS